MSKSARQIVLMVIVMGGILFAALGALQAAMSMAEFLTGANKPETIHVLYQDIDPVAPLEATPALGAELIFPDGWHMVGYSVSSGVARFVCQKANELRECTPAWVK